MHRWLCLKVSFTLYLLSFLGFYFFIIVYCFLPTLHNAHMTRKKTQTDNIDSVCVCVRICVVTRNQKGVFVLDSPHHRSRFISLVLSVGMSFQFEMDRLYLHCAECKWHWNIFRMIEIPHRIIAIFVCLFAHWINKTDWVMRFDKVHWILAHSILGIVQNCLSNFACIITLFIIYDNCWPFCDKIQNIIFVWKECNHCKNFPHSSLTQVIRYIRGMKW